MSPSLATILGSARRGSAAEVDSGPDLVTVGGLTVDNVIAADGAVAKRKSVSPDISPTSAGPPPL